MRVRIFCAAVFFTLSFAALGEPVPPWPNPNNFQSGDFLWPSRPGVFIPYANGANKSPDEAKKAWLKDRDEFVKRASQSGAELPPEKIKELKNMSFEEFYARYAGDKAANQVDLYSNSSPFEFVGHVAIVEIDSQSKIWVIEASLRDGVTRKPYAEWLKPLKDSLVWQGRLRQYSAAERAQIAQEAAKYVGRPYDFWNFDLDDDAGFYCSKLAWLSAFRTLKVSLDGNPSAKRQFWFSPKQLLSSPLMVKLHNPGSYGMP